MDEKKIRDLIAHYDNQSDEEEAAEIESARDAPMSTPQLKGIQGRHRSRSKRS